STYGGQNGPCYAPNAVTNNLAGRFGFQVGFLGSVARPNPATRRTPVSVTTSWR
ncbi:MAG: hypothetical protein UZ18_ATM001001189, partial [Armatimonadetes bacterium OLB18]